MNLSNFFWVLMGVLLLTYETVFIVNAVLCVCTNTCEFVKFVLTCVPVGMGIIGRISKYSR